jgi:hypothetical protein
MGEQRRCSLTWSGDDGSETTITITDIDRIILMAIQALEQRAVELQEDEKFMVSNNLKAALYQKLITP